MTEKLRFVLFLWSALVTCAPYGVAVGAVGVWLKGTPWFWLGIVGCLLALPLYVVWVLVPVMTQAERWTERGDDQ